VNHPVVRTLEGRIKSLNDGVVRQNPLPPDMWGSWSPHNPASQWIQYEWAKPVALDGSRILFWSDHPAGAQEGVAPPAAWHLEYWKVDKWSPVENASGYPTPVSSFADVTFDPVTTPCLRAVLDASGAEGRYELASIGVPRFRPGEHRLRAKNVGIVQPAFRGHIPGMGGTRPRSKRTLRPAKTNPSNRRKVILPHNVAIDPNRTMLRQQSG
jgi:hypothetical protein